MPEKRCFRETFGPHRFAAHPLRNNTFYEPYDLLYSTEIVSFALISVVSLRKRARAR